MIGAVAIPQAPARALTLLGAAWAGYVILLVQVPRWTPPDPLLPNAAARLGYDVTMAYAVILGWTVIAAATAWLNALPRYVPPMPAAAIRPVPALQKWAERLVVVLAVLALYWPPAIARFGPHVEDPYFLAALWRSWNGQIPYVDFEYLYGPLTLYPALAWMQVTGFSATAYYTVYTILAAAFFLGLTVLLQAYLPRMRDRLLAFALLVPMVADFLLGMNFIPWRYAAGGGVILLLAAQPRSVGHVALAGAVAGLGLAYSAEYGLAAMLSGIGIFLILLFEPGRGRVLSLAGLFVTVAAATGWGVGFGLTGAEFGAYLASARHVTATAGTLGLGQFAFDWTLNSLALFLLLALAVITGGLGLARLGKVSACEGDLHLTGAVAFTLITLRIALQRVDFLHLAIPFVPLMLILLLNRPRALFPAPQRFGTLAVLAMVLAASTQALGHLPTARWVAMSNLRGAAHVIAGRPVAGAFPSRGPGTEAERYAVRPQIIALADRLSAPDLADRPVLFYGNLWKDAAASGTPPVGYSFYDILYSDARVPLADTLRDRPATLVVIGADTWAQLQSGHMPKIERGHLNGLQHIAARTSSVHFEQTLLEDDVEYTLWKDALGQHLLDNYQPRETIEDLVILEHRP